MVGCSVDDDEDEDGMGEVRASERRLRLACDETGLMRTGGGKNGNGEEEVEEEEEVAEAMGGGATPARVEANTA